MRCLYLCEVKIFECNAGGRGTKNDELMVMVMNWERGSEKDDDDDDDGNEMRVTINN